MLSRLIIRNLAIIKEIELIFAKGLNIITGETGAGKSMLIDALNLLSGDRASIDMIREGEDSCEVQGIFDFNAIPQLVKDKLIENDIAVNDELNIRRVMHKNGRSRLYINGVIVTQSFLSSIGSMFISILSQHEHQKLFSSSSQLELLDRFIKVDKDVIELTRLYNLMTKKQKDYQELLEMQNEYIKKTDYLKFQLNELYTHDLKIDEEVTLVETVAKANNAIGVLRVLSNFKDAVSESEESSLSVFYKLITEMSKYQEIETGFTVIQEKLNDVIIVLEDLVLEAEKIAARYDFDEAEIEEHKERLFEIKRLKKKFMCSDIESLLQCSEQMRTELDELGNMDDKIILLEKELAQAKKDYESKAVKISETRKTLANTLSEKIEGVLESLGLFAGGFFINFTTVPATATGVDRIEFLISTNPGEPAKAISKIASGGELSRLMLAIQSSTNEVYGYGIQIYDEVDAGIGGDIAFKVGSLLKRISSNHQLIVITHLPQIAAFSDFHIKLWKEEAEGRTHVRINELRLEDDKSKEIGRMLGTGSATYIKDMFDKAKNILI